MRLENDKVVKMPDALSEDLGSVLSTQTVWLITSNKFSSKYMYRQIYNTHIEKLLLGELHGNHSLKEKPWKQI